MIKRLKQPDEIATVIRKVISQCPERKWTPKEISAEALVKGFADKGDITNIYGYYAPDGQPKGFLLGLVLEDPSTGEKVGSEFAWFVIPEWRGSGAAKELLQTFERDAKSEGATSMLAGFSMSVWAPKMIKLYRHLGYAPYLVTVRKKL